MDKYVAPFGDRTLSAPMDDELLIEISESRKTLSASVDDDKTHRYPNIKTTGDDQEAHKALDWRPAHGAQVGWRRCGEDGMRGALLGQGSVPL